MDEKETILIVDDDPNIQEVLYDYLNDRGYEVYLAENGIVMREKLAMRNVDVVLLDITLPGEDGLSLARDLRNRKNQLGIIMITGSGEVIDRVLGLEMGADDYIVKPFELREVLARIKSVLRRYQFNPERQPGENEKDASRGTVQFGEYMLDLDRRQLYHANGKEFPITQMEFDLLSVFSSCPNRVLSRDQILDLTQNREWDPYDRSIDIRIARLRRKIEQDPSNPQIIKTVRGAGYIFIPNENE